MGCKWPKFITTDKVVPVNNSTNQSLPALDYDVIQQQNTVSFDITTKQPASDIIDHSKQNNEHMVIDGSVDQSIPIPLENLKPVLPDESTKHVDIVIVPDTANYLASTSANNPMQTFEQMSTHETTNENLPQRINSGTSNKRQISANSQQQEDDHHKKLNDETLSITDKSIVEENIDIISNTDDDQIEKT